MIRINLFLICLATFVFASAQTTQRPTQQGKYYQEHGSEYFLNQSRKQQTAAWCMLGGGIVLGSAGYMLVIYSYLNDSWEYRPGTASLGVIMMYAGTGCVIGSVPLFIAAARNKGRSLAASASIKMDRVQMPVINGFAGKSYPALSFNLSLK